MTIVIVIHTLPRYSVGGSELCAVALAAELAKRHRVVVCAGRPAHLRSQPRQEPGPGYAIEWIDADPSRAPTFEAAYENTSIETQFDEIVRRVAPEIAHFHGIWTLSNNLPLIARRRGVGVVFTLHDFWLMCPRGQRLRPSDLSQCHEIDVQRCGNCLASWISPARLPSRAHVARLFGAERPPLKTIAVQVHARLFRRPRRADPITHVERYHAKSRELVDSVDLFVAPSRFLAAEFARHFGVAGDRLVYSDNGIDTAHFADASYKETSSVVRFGFLGSWMPSKGLHVLIDAFRGLTENARLVIFGGPPHGDAGDYARGLQHAADDRRITIRGRIAPEQRPAAFRSIDVLVVPSLWYENAPLTIREAFASHTPVVASRCGGMAESVRDDADGLLFAPGSVSDLRRVLRRLIHEPDLIPRLSRQTPAVKSTVVQASELDASFRRVIGQRPAIGGLGDAYPAGRP